MTVPDFATLHPGYASAYGCGDISGLGEAHAPALRALIQDAMIAATAIVHDLQVVTRNVKDFREFDVRMLNPYSPR
jgi:predicted nucleic acid-binding protein